jgi:hypothetical protein
MMKLREMGDCDNEIKRVPKYTCKTIESKLMGNVTA